MNKSHVDIIMLHVDIIYLACKGAEVFHHTFVPITWVNNEFQMRFFIRYKSTAQSTAQIDVKVLQ